MGSSLYASRRAAQWAPSCGVSSTLILCNTNSGSGGELIAIPYAYTIGKTGK